MDAKERVSVVPTSERTLAAVVEDHALEVVPLDQRKSGWSLSWMTMGIVTTLVQLLIAGYVTAVAGVALGILAGIVVAIFGARWVGSLATSRSWKECRAPSQEGFMALERGVR